MKFNYIAFCVGGIALLPWSAVSAGVVKFSYDVEVTPSQNLVDAYYITQADYEDEGNLFYEASSPISVTKIASSVAANTVLSATGSTSLSVPDAYLNDTVNGVKEQYDYAYGMIAALYVANPAAALPTYGVALSYNFDDGQSVLAQESDPSYDGTWDGTTIPSSANESVDVGVSEADAVTALLDGDTATLAAIETGAQDASEPLFILENLVNDPSVQLLDFSEASDGGNGSIDQDVTASVPEPGMMEFALLGAVGLFGSRRKRSHV